MKAGVLQSEFVKSVLKVFTGSAIAQFVPFLIEPVLTRLYTPAEFGVLAVYISFSTLFVVVATGRYEMAVVLPKTSRMAANTAGLALMIACGVSGVAAIIVLIAGPSIALAYRDSTVAGYLWFVPLSVLFVGFYQTFNNWALRFKRFWSISAGRISQTLTTTGLNLGLGLMGKGAAGLIVALVAGQLASLLAVFPWSKKGRRPFFALVNRSDAAKMAGRYADFPKINSLHAFSDILQQSLLIFLIAYYFGQDETGYYSRTFRILAAPVALLGSGIGQVFYQKASGHYARGGNLRPLVVQTIRNLAWIAAIGFGILMITGQWLFSVVLGEAWAEAGVYAQWLSPWMMMNFITSPVSSVPLIVGRQKQVFLISLIGNGLIVISVFLAGRIFGDLITGFMLLSAMMLVYYGFLIRWLLKISTGNNPQTPLA